MYFQLKLVIRGMTLTTANELRYQLTNPMPISIRLMRVHPKLVLDQKYIVVMQLEEGAANVSSLDAEEELLCVVTMERHPSSKTIAAFSNLASGTLKAGPVQPMPLQIKEGRPNPSYSRQGTGLPQGIVDSSSQMYQEMLGIGVRLLMVLRWRSNASGSHNPVHGAQAGFSLDGKDWHPLPIEQGMFVDVTRDVRASDAEIREVEQLVEQGTDEPLAHVLFRESWLLRKSSPRSALLMGMAAAEVGVKHCVRKLVPSADWLVENLPSPPLIQILTQYLPVIPAKCTISGKVVAPPKVLLDEIRDGISMRNRVAHTGNQAIRPEKLAAILMAVEDLLWLLDYYSGQQWALDHMRKDVRELLLS